MNCLACAGPDAIVHVDAQSVVDAVGALDEDLAAAQLATVYVEDAHDAAPLARVGDVQALLVDREREAVGLREAVGNGGDAAGARVDAIDATLAELARRLEPFVVRIDAVGRIGEPDRVVGLHDDVVRAVEALTLEALGQYGDGAVVLGAHDAPQAVLTRDEPALAIDSVAVGVVSGLAENAHRARLLVEAQHAVIRDVTEQQRAQRREVDRALGPATARMQLLDVGAGA